MKLTVGWFKTLIEPAVPELEELLSYRSQQIERTNRGHELVQTNTAMCKIVAPSQMWTSAGLADRVCKVLEELGYQATVEDCRRYLPEHAADEAMMHTAHADDGRFLRANRPNPDAEFSSKKQFKWNVDHLLEKRCVELVAAYVIPSEIKELEELLGLGVQSLPAARIDHRRLGSADFKDNTHLLRIEADDRWWERFEEDLEIFVRAITKLKNEGAYNHVREGLKRCHITARQLRTLSNMHADRRNYIFGGLFRDPSFAHWIKESTEKGIYDTRSWGEVISRLGRGRGSVRKAVAILFGPGAGVLHHAESASEIAAYSKQLVALSQRLFRQISSRTAPGEVDADARARHRTDILARTVGRVSFSRLRGYLKACIAFLQKNIRDTPQIYHKTGFRITGDQRTKIESQLVDILKSCAVLDDEITRTR